MRELLQAGVHFGHHPRRWNPKMDQYLFGVRNDIHIINLEKTVPMLHQALQAVHDVVKSGGKVLFVGTKDEASKIVKAAAEKAESPYVTNRWIGGLLTNFTEMKKRINRLDTLTNEKTTGELDRKYTKKERVVIGREANKQELEILSKLVQGPGFTKNKSQILNALESLTKQAEKRSFNVTNRLQAFGMPTDFTNKRPSNTGFVRNQ